jgi:hypothetical protein
MITALIIVSLFGFIEPRAGVLALFLLMCGLGLAS